MADPRTASAVVEARRSTPITPHDSNAQPTMRGIYVGAGGTIVGRLKDDTADRTFVGLLTGVYYPFAFALIKSTGTTAGSLIALH